MSNDTIQIHNAETNEITIVSLTDAEQVILNEEREKAIANKQAKLEQIENDALAKIALLEKLGITEDEARLLLGS
jgi:hypothetical protein